MAFFETVSVDAHLMSGSEQNVFGDEEKKMRATERDGLSSYLRGLGGHKQLTREEEYELSRRARKGDESARQTLATSNLPLWLRWPRSSPPAALGSTI